MDRPERSEKDDAQKAKLIFLSLAAIVAILLAWSLYSATRAKSERNEALRETEMFRQENAKLEQLLKEQNQEIDNLKSMVRRCEAKIKAKPKAKTKAAARKRTKQSSRKRR